MPHVTVNYEMFLPGGHHRQPRNTTIDLALAPTAGGDISPMGTYSPPFFPQLPYTLGGGSGMASLLFWSVTDGTSGQVLPPSSFTQTVGASPLVITAWYFPTSGPGTGSGTEIIDDAFSANLGRFIDDTFVDVVSDPSLTSDANVVGVVPTSSAETLVAKNSVTSTTEPFSKWILNGGFMPAGATTLNVPRGTIGMAIAVYQQSGTTVSNILGRYVNYNPWWWIETWWGHGPDDPERVGQLLATLSLVETATRISPGLRTQVLEAALEQLTTITASIQNQVKAARK